MEIICLANSFKNQGRCIAGIDRQSGQWVRPISDFDDGRIPVDNEFIPASNIRILDILNIPIDIGKKSGHEVENIGYINSPWQIIDRAKVVDLLKYREEKLLFPNYEKAIPYQYIETQAPVRTLQLVEVKSFACHKNSQGKWRGVIGDEKYDFADINLSITDPLILEKLNQGQTISSHCFVCLSFGQPWRPDASSPLQCYRLIAGVVELLPELQLITKEMERLSWSTEQGKQYLQEKSGKKSRYQLTETEAKQFLSHLKSSGKN